MGNIIACIGAGIGWCFCTASMSLCSSCCGTDKASHIPPGSNSGRKRSVFLLVLSIGIALGFQYGVAPKLQSEYDTFIKEKARRYLVDSWTSGCEDLDDYDLQQKCAGNSGVYRVAASTFFFFLLATIAAACKPTANREAWPAKFILYLFLVLGSVFIPNDPLFDPVLMNIFRIGAVLFIVFQQVIIIDLAYNLNDSWVTKADRLDREEGEGVGAKWLRALLVACAFLFIASFVVIGFMYKYFSCGLSTTFTTITLVMGLLCTGVQLSGEDSSLFASAAIFAYATYINYSAISKNPNGACNPTLGEEDILGSVLGISITLLSLAWAGWSHTANKTVRNESNDDEENIPDTNRPNVISSSGNNDDTYGTLNDDNNNLEQEKIHVDGKQFSDSWKLNFVLVIVTCWYAMSLTAWGSYDKGGNSANPEVGRVSMWMMISSEWLCLTLYLWTLVAPRLFPDRDFS